MTEARRRIIQDDGFEHTVKERRDSLACVPDVLEWVGKAVVGLPSPYRRETADLLLTAMHDAAMAFHRHSQHSTTSEYDVTLLEAL